MKDKKWLRKSKCKLNQQAAEKLLDYWMKVLGMGSYAFKIKLTNDKRDGRITFKVGVHYGEIEFSTERVLIHELLEAMLLRYKEIVGYKEVNETENYLRHILIFQLVNALLRLKYGE